jgi:hypothetical protein
LAVEARLRFLGERLSRHQVRPPVMAQIASHQDADFGRISGHGAKRLTGSAVAARANVDKLSGHRR